MSQKKEDPPNHQKFQLKNGWKQKDGNQKRKGIGVDYKALTFRECKILSYFAFLSSFCII